jgi:hypothetical protein
VSLSTANSSSISPDLIVFLFGFQIQVLSLSFKTAKALRGRIEMLPKGPEWKSQQITIDGYHTKSPMILYYRNPVKCVKMLLSNPLFTGQFDFIAECVYTSPHRSERKYGEWMTSDGAWFMQVSHFL